MASLQRISVGASSQALLDAESIDRLGYGLRHDGAILVELVGLEADMVRLRAASEMFFSLPERMKSNVYIGDSICHRGYVPPTEKGSYADEGDARRYESFDVGLELPLNDTHVAMGTPLMGPNNWPDLPGFKDCVYGCFETINDASYRVLQALSIYLGLGEGFFQPLVQKPISQLRLLHYMNSPIRAGDQTSAMGAHTDYEFFSLIEATSGGLQVCTHDNGWIDVITSRATFVMLVGDMLETVSNGLFRSVLHRVHDTGQERYAFPFFCGADFDAVLRPVTKGIFGARTARYPALPAGEYLLDRFKRDFPYLQEQGNKPQRFNMDSVFDNDEARLSWFERRRMLAAGLHD